MYHLYIFSVCFHVQRILYVSNIILYYITRKFRRHFLVWKLEIIQYRKLKRKSRWKYLNLCDLLYVHFIIMLCKSIVSNLSNGALRRFIALSSLFTKAESLHPLLYTYNINITCTYKSPTLLFTFPLLEITLIRFWYTSRPVLLNT